MIVQSTACQNMAVTIYIGENRSLHYRKTSTVLQLRLGDPSQAHQHLPGTPWAPWGARTPVGHACDSLRVRPLRIIGGPLVLHDSQLIYVHWIHVKPAC